MVGKPYETRSREIESVLVDSGVGGLTVGKIAKEIRLSKTRTHMILQRMCDEGLIERCEVDYQGRWFVIYRYFQMPLPGFEAGEGNDNGA